MSRVWQSFLTSEDVSGYTPEEIELLKADLDDAVMATIEDFGGLA
jgi:hypothetical protein